MAGRIPPDKQKLSPLLSAPSSAAGKKSETSSKTWSGSCPCDALKCPLSHGTYSPVLERPPACGSLESPSRQEPSAGKAQGVIRPLAAPRTNWFFLTAHRRATRCGVLLFCGGAGWFQGIVATPSATRMARYSGTACRGGCAGTARVRVCQVSSTRCARYYVPHAPI